MTDSILMIVGVLVLALFAIYLINPSILNIFSRQGFEDMSAPNTVPSGGNTQTKSTGEKTIPPEVAGAMQAMMNMNKASADSGSAQGFEDMDEVGRALAAGQDIAVFQSKLRNYGATAMPDFIRKQIAEGADLDDAIAPYRTVLADELEIPLEQVDVTDKTIQDGLANNFNLSQFRRAVRKDPRWPYTNNAKSTVIESINAILGGE
jgi:hypothetical protein